MEWFGNSWGAPVNRQADHVDTPVGTNCASCESVIWPGDKGFVLTDGPWHFRCLMRSIFGPRWQTMGEP